MRRLKYLFAGLILLLTLPTWRLLDWANVTLPFQIILTIIQFLWALVFIAFPVKLVFPSMKPWKLLLGLIIFGVSTWLSGPFSSKSTLQPELSQCSQLSYTGFFYPVRNLLSNAYIDDLEVRNQLCWIVKMIQKVPSEIEASDLAGNLNLTKFKLLKPSNKYRVAMPWIAFLMGKYLTSTQIKNSPLLLENLSFWAGQYTEEISARTYNWYDWPQSSFIKLEYGLIEKNWEHIHFKFGY